MDSASVAALTIKKMNKKEAGTGLHGAIFPSKTISRPRLLPLYIYSSYKKDLPPVGDFLRAAELKGHVSPIEGGISERITVVEQRAAAPGLR